MRPAANRGLRSANAPPADFHKFELGRRIIYLRRDLIFGAPAILASLSTLGARQGIGNRSSGLPLKLPDGTELFARMGHRGGLMRPILNDLYLGLRARNVRELEISAEARRRGIPVAESVGAVIEWVAPILYRSIFLTRALPGMTLWEFLRTDDDAVVRSYIMEQTRKTIDTMHRLGLFHADLNLHNLFVTKVHENFAIAILDLDKARLFSTPVPAKMRAQNFARLRRSARKLDPNQVYMDSQTLEMLTHI